MSDLIDRQQAIEAICMGTCGVSLKTERCMVHCTEVQAVEKLPPAQPEQLGTNLASLGMDCISRQVAIEGKIYIQRSNGVEIYDDYVVPVEYLKQLPPAQPERIIRCKDCKHWIPYDWMFSEVWQSRNINDYPEDEIGCKYCDMTMKADDFCSRAEMREVTE